MPEKGTDEMGHQQIPRNGMHISSGNPEDANFPVAIGTHRATAGVFRRTQRFPVISYRKKLV